MPTSSTIAPAPTEFTESAPHEAAPQHLQALARANRVRLARAALKRSVAADQRSVAEVVVECPWECESMSLLELLSSQRRWGRTRSRKFIVALGLTENKRIGTLTARQRELLASALRAKSQTLEPELERTAIVGAAAVAA